jgi:hypothetical protein
MSIPINNIMNQIPIILCGKASPVATGVKETIRPAYEGKPNIGHIKLFVY